MASIIRIKRSTGTSAPGTLNYGELAYTTGVGTFGNSGGRLFVGDPSQNPLTIGGRYYTDLLGVGPGLVAGQTNPTTAANGFVAILDQNRKVDQWNVDNLRLDGNTVSSTDTNGHIYLTPDGNGEVILLNDDYLTFGTSQSSKIKYNNTNTVTEVSGADWNFLNGVAITLSDTTTSSNTTTGALIVSGGVGIASNVYIGGISSVRHNLTVDGASFLTNQTTFNVINTNATSVNAFGAATNLVIGATSGVATYRNTESLFTNSSNSSFVSIAATTAATSTSTGALRVAGGVGIASDVWIGGTLNITGLTTITGDTTFNNSVSITQNLTVNGNTNLGNSATDIFTVTGLSTFNGQIVNTGGGLFDSVGIKSNTIYTRSGAGNVLYIDPYPDGLSNEGTVVIKGDLQVDGTTTSVNSTAVTVNEAILNLGDVNSARTVMQTVQTGVSTVTLDSVVGINTGDLISGSSSLPSGGITTVTAYNTTTNIVTFTGTTSGGISTTTQLTIQHNYDTNTDRGISFQYNTSSGAANSKKGFFGYIDGTNVNSSAPVRSWTYIPDAAVTNSVATGTRGYLDVKGIYYQTGDFSTHGVVYFDSTGIQTSTTAPSAATITSTQLLTAVTEITITLATSQSVTQGDQVTQQNNSGAYGMVKTTSSGTTITLIGAQGTFDTTNNLVVNGTSISKIPSTVSTVYTSRPMWTTTLDGGTF